jgi:hypothetical protein
VEEQSHKDEMRAALRGDFERMRRRLSQGADPTVEPQLPEKRAPQGGGAEVQGGSWFQRLLGRA